LKFPYEKICLNIEDTKELAIEFAKNISAGDLIVLNGNLGSGKTFFVKEVLFQFGINNVTSPSFAIVNEYGKDNKFYHFDFYRLKNKNELDDIGFQDYLNDFDSIFFIEWGELFSEALPKNFIEIRIENLGESKRKFGITKHG
tara:strand:- start:129 stop:557 length:429 start_codon:yes stop_codon:yes gene_type:complete